MSENQITVSYRRVDGKSVVKVDVNSIPLYEDYYSKKQDELIYQTVLTVTRTIDAVHQPYSIWFTILGETHTTTNPVSFPTKFYTFMNSVKKEHAKVTS